MATTQQSWDSLLKISKILLLTVMSFGLSSSMVRVYLYSTLVWSLQTYQTWLLKSSRDTQWSSEDRSRQHGWIESSGYPIQRARIPYYQIFRQRQAKSLSFLILSTLILRSRKILREQLEGGDKEQAEPGISWIVNDVKQYIFWIHYVVG